MLNYEINRNFFPEFNPKKVDSSKIASRYSEVNTYNFDTDAYSPAEQFNRFAVEMSPVAELVPPLNENYRTGFETYLNGYELGSVNVVLHESKSFRLFRSLKDVIRLGVDHWTFMLCIEGQFDITTASGSETVRSGDLALKTLEQPLSVNYETNKTAYFCVPRHLLPGLEGNMDAYAQSNGKGRDVFHPFLIDYLRSLVATLPHMSKSEASLAEEAFSVMVRASLTWSRESFMEAQPAILATQLEMAKKYIDDNLMSPDLSVDDLQRFLRVSRRQLYKVFEAQGGVNRYIRLRRLEACYREILKKGTSQPIYRTAERFGFLDAANFSRIFRAEFGCSASELLEISTCDPASRDYMEWLRR